MMSTPPKKKQKLTQVTIFDSFHMSQPSASKMNTRVADQRPVSPSYRDDKPSPSWTLESTSHSTAQASSVNSTTSASAQTSTRRSSSDECTQTQEYSASQPLFDSDVESRSSADVIPESGDVLFKGCPKCELLTKPACAAKLPNLKSTPSHTVLVDFRSRSTSTSPMKPYPHHYTDYWDASHVRMPCSKENLYPVDGPEGKKELQNRWTLIKSALQAPLTSSYDIEEAILVYNSRYSQKWEFSGLHSFLNEVLTKDENKNFFSNTLPKMVKLALELPDVCTQALPLLKRGANHSITMSQHQAACLLANAFFCTFPRRNTRQKTSEYSSFPDINFNDLFSGRDRRGSRKKEKLKCLLAYFERVTQNMPPGNLTFTRRYLSDADLPSWASSTKPFTKLRAQSSGMIEDDGYGMLQVDFANKYLGGGVLNTGLVQEEIRFMICPEMILSRLVTEVLGDSECLVMIGCERFSNYTGYSDTFKWAGPHLDPTPRDAWERLHCEVVAIDAVRFTSTDRQYAPSMLRRELDKAYCGFKERLPKENLSAVATGNWGCGAFRGDPRLKFLVQMMALAECCRDVCYFTFGDPDLCHDIHDMHAILIEKDMTVGDIWALLVQYGRYSDTTRQGKRTLFRYIIDSLAGTGVESEGGSTPGFSDSPDWGDQTP